jgi:hypothetical protein
MTECLGRLSGAPRRNALACGPARQRAWPRSAIWLLVILALFLSGCAGLSTTPGVAATTPSSAPNLDPQTQAVIARAPRVAFVIPFSHWDTDWHDTYAEYAKLSDGNILAAILLAKRYPAFRYAFEQTLFVQHFWENHPEYQDELQAMVHRRQLTFAWAGITQPETSLVAPAIQVRNLRLGQAWIADTFGQAYVPHTAWQSDAFGTSAAFPALLSQLGIPYLFVGRWQAGCDPDYANCTPYPHAFYWKSPTSNSRVLTVYLEYPNAYVATSRSTKEAEQLAALRTLVDREFTRTRSKYIFVPMGFDFADPLPNLPSLVDRWNAADPHTKLVMADPETAFGYLRTQSLPEVTADFNPIWQAFYGSRPFAKIADKESEYFLTAGDKFGWLVGAPASSAWQTAAVDAHYDNIGAVGFDSVWESSQRPRFELAVSTAANDLASILASVASGTGAPLVVFNPTSWPRSEVVEIDSPGVLPDLTALPPPVQYLGPQSLAFRVSAVPPIGFLAFGAASSSFAASVGEINNPATVSQTPSEAVTLTNGLVAVTLDPDHGGAFSSMGLAGSPSLLSAFGDDVTYWDDTGDIYGAFFGNERARESHVGAQITVLASGPLLARAQAVFSLGGQVLTKTVTLRAGSPLIEVVLQLKALPGTTAIVQTPTSLRADSRTDDLGFMAFTHTVDNRPIVPGDVTYRREIFYPVTYWSDVSEGSSGLSLITHGLQGVGGMGELNLLLVRDVTTRDEGVTDLADHTLRYAYLPHAGTTSDIKPWLAAYALNQPLIPVWRTGGELLVQLPFGEEVRRLKLEAAGRSFPASLSLISAQGGLVADLFRDNGQTTALVLNYEPATPVTLSMDGQPPLVLRAPLSLVPVALPGK